MGLNGGLISFLYNLYRKGKTAQLHQQLRIKTSSDPYRTTKTIIMYCTYDVAKKTLKLSSKFLNWQLKTITSPDNASKPDLTHLFVLQ